MLHELSSAPLVAWGNAWLLGHTGLDDAVDAVERDSGPHTVGAAAEAGPGLDGEGPLRAVLARLRSHGPVGFGLALPVPGDPLGLSGPAALNTAAIEAREAVLLRLSDRRVGLVPEVDRRGSSYAGVRWCPHPAADRPPEPVPLAEAEQRLSHAIREATTLFDRVSDIGTWTPEVERALADLRNGERAPGAGLAPGYPQRAHRVAALADRLAVVIRLADSTPGRGISSEQTSTRAAALRELDQAVRRARVAAHNAILMEPS